MIAEMNKNCSKQEMQRYGKIYLPWLVLHLRVTNKVVAREEAIVNQLIDHMPCHPLEKEIS